METNIESFKKGNCYVTIDATSYEALAAFNALVQDHVLRAMKASLGTSPVQILHVALLLCLTNFAFALDKYSALVKDSRTSVTELWPWMERLKS